MSSWFLGTGWSCTKSRNAVEAGRDSNLVSVIGGGGSDNDNNKEASAGVNINGNNITINGMGVEKYILETVRQENKDLSISVYVLRNEVSEGKTRTRDFEQKIKDLSDRVLSLESSLRENTVTSREILEHCKDLRLEISALEVLETPSLLEKIDIIIEKTKDIHMAGTLSSEEFEATVALQNSV